MKELTVVYDFRERRYQSQSARLDDGTPYPKITFQYGDRRVVFDPAGASELLYALDMSLSEFRLGNTRRDVTDAWEPIADDVEEMLSFFRQKH